MSSGPRLEVIMSIRNLGRETRPILREINSTCGSSPAKTGLKRISTAARKELEEHFHCKVYLDLWVKVKEGWADNAKLLAQLGYYDEGSE